MGSRSGALAVVLGVAVLAGCYGSTEPATDIGERTATLKARGTTEDVPARSYFEFTPVENILGLRTTDARNWPAGVTGPVSERVTDLLVAAEYEFRFCGADSGEQPVCAQWRRFTTATPGGDYARGEAVFFQPRALAVRANVSAGPQGQSPTGRVEIGQTGTSDPFNGTATCLATSGAKAVIGAIEPGGRSALLSVEDGAQDKLGLAFGSGPPDCTSPTAPPPSSPPDRSSLVVRDVP